MNATIQDLLDKLNEQLVFALKCTPASSTQVKRMDVSAVVAYLTKAIELTKQIESERAK